MITASKSKRTALPFMNICTVAVAVVLMLALLLTGCTSAEPETPKGSRTINGNYYNSELDIGYMFMTEGFGVQLIAGNSYQIHYYILGSRITIENFSVQGGDVSTFDFSEGADYVIIQGKRFEKVEAPEFSA